LKLDVRKAMTRHPQNDLEQSQRITSTDLEPFNETSGTSLKMHANISIEPLETTETPPRDNLPKSSIERELCSFEDNRLPEVPPLATNSQKHVSPTEAMEMSSKDQAKSWYYEKFTSTYPEYIGSENEFMRSLVYLEWLSFTDNDPNPNLWDDFIRCYADEYSEYLLDAAAKGVAKENRLSGRKFYKNILGHVHKDFHFQDGADCIVNSDTVSEALLTFDEKKVEKYRSIYRSRPPSDSNKISPGHSFTSDTEGCSQKSKDYVPADATNREPATHLQGRRFFETYSQIDGAATQEKSLTKLKSPIRTPQTKPTLALASTTPLAKGSPILGDSPLLRRAVAGPNDVTDLTMSGALLEGPISPPVLRSRKSITMTPPDQGLSKDELEDPDRLRLRAFLNRKNSQSSRNSTPRSTPRTSFCTKPKAVVMDLEDSTPSTSFRVKAQAKKKEAELEEPETQNWQF